MCQASITETTTAFYVFSTKTDRFYLNKVFIFSLPFRHSTENVWKMLKSKWTYYIRERFCRTPREMSRRVTQARQLRQIARNLGVIYRTMFFLIFGGLFTGLPRYFLGGYLKIYLQQYALSSVQTKLCNL